MDPLDQRPPHDRDAERAIIGAVLTAPKLFASIELQPADFYLPAHELIWESLAELHRHGQPADAISLGDYLWNKGLGQRTGGRPYLHDCVATVPFSSFPANYAQIVADHALSRRLLDALATAGSIAQGGDDPDRKLELIEKLIGGVQNRRESDDLADLMSLDEFVDRDLGDEEWVIPGLLAREERLIVTGSEGLGKSTLIRQFAASVAGGMNPVTSQIIPRQKVLYVDVENPERIMQRKMDDIRRVVRGHQANPGESLWINRRPGGLNLCEAVDRRWLSRRMDAVQPDLLVIGPLYKLTQGASFKTDEEKASATTAVLDEFRNRYGCALMMEAHSPKATEGGRRLLEPIGSSLWMRWPEFGIGLGKADHPAAKERRMVDVVHWRGPRDERRWPLRLEAGGMDALPWVECVL